MPTILNPRDFEVINLDALGMSESNELIDSDSRLFGIHLKQGRG